MDFPITDLMSEKASTEWILEYFHPNGLRCPHCGAAWAEASEFRRTKRSELTVYRCRRCRGIYNLYSGTVFEARQLRPAQVVLLVRGVLKGESAAILARELAMSRTTVTELRHLLQANAVHLQTELPLNDNVVEADELFQNAGEKRGRTLRPT
jgi:transposase-like protein